MLYRMPDYNLWYEVESLLCPQSSVQWIYIALNIYFGWTNEYKEYLYLD